MSKEQVMTIRFIGGLWRRIDGTNVRSFATFQDAVDNKNAWEDHGAQVPSDDILQQMSK